MTAARLGLAALFFAAVVIALAFLILPVVAIFAHVPPSALLHQLSTKVVTDALVVSAKTSIAAQIAIVLLGTPTAYFFATRRFPGRSVLVTLVELPIVMPPAVAGLGLIVTFDRLGLIGKHWPWLVSQVSFNQTAVVFAIVLVAGPFYVRQGIAAFEAIDPNIVAASRTLGAGPLKTFFRVVLPLARSGLGAGFALSLARGLGEFGATIMFAGNLEGRTQTLPLAVYTEFEANIDAALAMSALLIVISFAILLSLKASGLWRRARPVVVAGR